MPPQQANAAAGLVLHDAAMIRRRPLAGCSTVRSRFGRVILTSTSLQRRHTASRVSPWPHEKHLIPAIDVAPPSVAELPSASTRFAINPN